MCLITEHQSASVEVAHVHAEDYSSEDLQLELRNYLELVIEEYLDYGEDVPQKGLGDVDLLAILTKHPVHDQVPNPDHIVLPYEDGQEGHHAQSPLALDQIVVIHYGHQGNTGCVSVVQEIEEEDGRCECQVEAARQVVRTGILEVIDFHDEDHKQVREDQTVDTPHCAQTSSKEARQDALQPIKPRWSRDLGMPLCETVLVVSLKLLVVELLVHVGFGDNVVEQKQQEQVRDVYD